MATSDKKTPVHSRKRTKELLQRLEEMGADPLKFAVDVMDGRELTTDHPFLKVLYNHLRPLRRAIKDDKEALRAMEELEDVAVKYLRNGHVPIEIRSRHALELLQYMYPKRKSVDHSGTIGMQLNPDSMSDEMLTRIMTGQATAEEMMAFLEGTEDAGAAN